MMKQYADFAALCAAWSKFLMERYEIDIEAESVGMILTRLDGGTKMDYDLVMRYIGSRERDDRSYHIGRMQRIGAEHCERVDSIEMKAKRERRALQDRRSRATGRLRMALMQCDTEIERGAAYAAMDKEVEEIAVLMASVDDAEHSQKKEERSRYLSAVESEELRYGRMLYGWRMWRDATDRMFALGLELPQEEEGGKL